MQHVVIPRVKDETLYAIIDCIRQKTMTTENFPEDFFVISVWFPEPANRILKANTPANGFCIMFKEEDGYSNSEIIKHAKAIWANGLLPIEIIQNEGGIFYSTPRIPVLCQTALSMVLLNAEYDIPTLDDFY